MDTKKIIESLLFNIPEIRKPLFSLSVISKDRMISSVERKEYDNVLKEFTKNSKIISIHSTMQTVAIVQKIKRINKFKILIIKGNYSRIITLSKSGLVLELLENLFIKEYLPSSFQNKIIYIDSYDEENNYGAVFSEYLKNEWTMDDPMKLDDIATIKNYSAKHIIKSIVDGVMEKQKEEEKGNI